MAQLAFHTSIGLIYVNAIREFFATHKLAGDFRWSEDVDKRDIEIVQQWPKTPQNFPLIVVDTVFSGEGERYLSDGADRLDVDGRHEGQMFSGVDNFDVRMSINDFSKTSVDKATDLILFGLKRHIERTIWNSSLMTVIPQRSARASGAGARPYTDSQLLYFVTLSQPVKTHWFDEVIYNPRILTYLATAERDGLEAAATTFQMRAGTE